MTSISANRLRLVAVGTLAATLLGIGIRGLSVNPPEPTSAIGGIENRQLRADHRLERADPWAAPQPTTTAAKAFPKATISAPPATSGSSKAATPAACLPYHGNQLIACRLLPQYGLGYEQMGSLVQLWTRESGWNQYATNPYSGAYGIPQALPADKLAAAGSDWRTNPTTQIKWGLSYIRGVYGTPDKAWAFWNSNSPNWY
jgi:hypothetical protein